MCREVCWADRLEVLCWTLKVLLLVSKLTKGLCGQKLSLYAFCQSLCDSLDPFGDAFPVPLTPELNKGPPLSARERRRLAKQQPQVDFLMN